MEYSLKNRNQYSNQTRTEEILNTITHLIGVGLSIAALVLLVVYSAFEGSTIKIVSFSIYGASLIILFSTSSIYHFVKKDTFKAKFQLMDHASIYLLIAGSYTPILLVAVKGAWGWSLFGVLWGFAVIGILFKLKFTGRYELVSTIIYLIMGWLVVFFAYPVLTYLSPMSIAWLFIGGGAYTLGTIFFFRETLPFHHSIWHLFVLGGSISHFFCFFFHILHSQ